MNPAEQLNLPVEVVHLRGWVSTQDALQRGTSTTRFAAHLHCPVMRGDTAGVLLARSRRDSRRLVTGGRFRADFRHKLADLPGRIPGRLAGDHLHAISEVQQELAVLQLHSVRRWFSKEARSCQRGTGLAGHVVYRARIRPAMQASAEWTSRGDDLSRHKERG